MKFSCDQCHAQYMIADEKVGQRGVKVKCKKCGNIIIVKPLTVHERSSAASASVGTIPAGGATVASGSGGNGAALGSPFGGATAPSGPTAATTGAPADFGGAASGPAFGGFGGGLGLGGSAMPESAAGGPKMAQGGLTAAAVARSASSPAIDTELSLGALTAATTPAAKPAPSRRPPGEKEWYVAIDDSQVGPIDLAEIEEKWDGRELDEESLAWKAGMVDWMPVAEIPELAYLVSERPHPKPQPRPARASAASGAVAPGASVGPVAFGSSAAAEDVSWKPSAASALSSLVQEELIAATAPKPESKRPASAGVPEDLGIPSFGSKDLFAGGGNGAAVAPRADPFASPAPAWSVPVVPRRSGGFRWMYALFGVLGVAIVGLGYLLLQQRIVRAPMASGAPVPAAAVASTPTAPVAAPAPTHPTASPPPERPAAVAPRERERPSAPRERERETPREVPREAPKEREKPKASEDPLDAIDEPKAPAKAALTKQDIVDGIKRNAGSVAPCLKDARAKNEIMPNSYTFLLDWVVRPDGSVANPRLKGPPEVMGTSLPACFASVMRRWTFPASQKEAPITNFPFGPINIR